MDLPEIENQSEAQTASETLMTIATPCKWAKVLKAARSKKFPSKPPEYSISIELEKLEAEPMITEIRDAMVAFAAEQKNKNISFQGWSQHRGFKEDEESGVATFNFKQSPEHKPKDGGDTLYFSVDVYDAQMNHWPKDLAIGNGSIVKIAYSLSPWNVAAQGGIGNTLRLRGVQVLEHVPYEIDRTHGFTTEAGCVASSIINTSHSDSDSGPDTAEPPQQEEKEKPVYDVIPF